MNKINAILIKRCIFFVLIGIIALSAICTAFSWISSWLALVLGMMFTLFLGNPYEGRIENFTSALLKISVVAIGFGYPLSAITELSSSSLYFVIIFIVIALAFGAFLTRIFAVDNKIGHMISSGTAICGASAIAAIASAIQANNKQTSIALGTVFILSASGLILFPVIGNYLQLSQEQFGIWAGLTIHDTASAIGAAIDFDTEYQNKIAEKTTVIIKLAKVIFIIPLVFFGAWMHNQDKQKNSFPYFILFFLLAMLLNSTFPAFEGFSTIKTIGKKGLQISLFLIGTNLSIHNLKTIGIKPFLHGLLIWTIVSISSLLAILYFVK